MNESRPMPVPELKGLSVRRRRHPGGDTLPEFSPLRQVLDSTGTVIELTYPDLLVGRHSEADIRLPLPEVSRRHCKFFFCEGQWYIRDLKSLNGVYLNERAVGQAPLLTGDRLKIGGFAFTVEAAGNLPADGPEGVVRRLLRDLPITTSNSHLRRAS